MIVQQLLKPPRSFFAHYHFFHPLMSLKFSQIGLKYEKLTIDQ